ncbi:MAG: hypothetical protein PHG15_09980 [Acinetobacter sp.]|jgi:hypothetical protein|uniref:hypothetical protein n=1 Tax=unclassified Acinetobacter TaxID=196816 RepID=UPI002625DE83|nr:hypothetical protein [Acinetobacter sp.]MDD2946095.1 hypothetical protein [Acinetobacter sp.]
MKKYPLLNYVGSYAQELLYETSNSALLGIPEALKNTTQKIYAQSKLNNEALYYLQVKTFLETLDLDEDEVSQFMQKNPNHQRLGLEIFKILESTILEKQAQLLAKSFKYLTKKEIDDKTFNQYTYIITKLNNHLINLLQELYFLKTNNENPEFEFDISNPNMELVSFQFLREVESPLVLDGKTKIARYKRTDEFYHFYENIFKD